MVASRAVLRFFNPLHRRRPLSDDVNSPEQQPERDGDERQTAELLERFQAMSRGRKIVLIVFVIWAIQAIPKWTAAIVADGETSADIMKFFITPR